ncbi:Enolase [Capsicum annuum]|nr:Enolase [Capsicum annuum]
MLHQYHKFAFIASLESFQYTRNIQRNQTDGDAVMLDIDGTPNQSKLGASAILGVSLSVCRVGSHTHNNLAMQEFMILPVGASTFAKALRMGSEVYHTLKGIIKTKYGQVACNVCDEGGFAPNVQDNKEGLALLMDAIEKDGYTGKVQTKIGMDVATFEVLPKDAKYDLNFNNQPNDGAHVLSAQGLCELYKEYVKYFPIVFIEVPFDQDDWSSWVSLQSLVNIQLVGGDFLVTNPRRTAEVIPKKECNTLLLKVYMNCTVTKSIEAALESKAADRGVMVSHRSGETEDNFIADLSAEGEELVLSVLTGSVKSLKNFPCFMSHATRPAEVREARGLTEDLIRISVGIEDVNDLIDDLDYAIKTGPT